jgi:hypothetical protein
MKIVNIMPFISWMQDLKSGKLINHQPARKKGHSKWYQKVVEKEGRKLA